MKPKKKSSSAVAEQEQGPTIPWSARLWSSIGLPWILCGCISYTVLTMLGRAFLHNPAGLAELRKEVPNAVYDRSTSIFLTALAIDILNIVFERQTIKLDCVLLPAFIKGMASTTNILVRFFTPVIALTNLGRPVVVQRYICWMHTTPSILMLLKMISTTITPRETMIAIFFDEVMVVTGVLALVTTGWQRVLWSFLTHVAMLPVVPYMHKAFTECIAAHSAAARTLAPLWASPGSGSAGRRGGYDDYDASGYGGGSGGGGRPGLLARAMEQIRTRPLQLTMLCIYVLNLVLWCTFAVTWDLALLGWISVTMEEVLYVACDFSAKVLFSSTLMLSSFKEIEARRENAMRVIEGSSKAKLIAELQALLEQKERFMSSVSHELRTPLNGIIGISEGMLSGCCGVLPEGVRRQIYIIRTSGARLLALINDVMDAAALRQNKLVLKQEQVVLRHVVDDVLDLTRSLVDGEVALVNLVPPRMMVVGDTGRIVQILNNLLGNAAKFTRRGQIRVTARQVESGRKVAVTVSDTGIGIPRNKLATIFLPFEQVDMSISRKYGGFGLGLNIVQELVKAHGGTINVSSIEGKGSAFTFTMPLLRALGRESLEEGRNAAVRAAAAGGVAKLVGGAGLSTTDTSSQLGGSTSGSGGAPGTGGGGTLSAAVSTATPRGGSRTPGGGGGAATISDYHGDTDTVYTHRSDVSESSRVRGGGGGGLGGDSQSGADATTAELEQYGELKYNAAELSALASSRPYAQSAARDSLPSLAADGGSVLAMPSGALSPSVVHDGSAGGAGGGGLGGGSSSQLPALPSGSAAVAAAARARSRAGDRGRGGKGGAAGGGDGAAAGGELPGGKFVSGPKPFHYTMYKRFQLLSVDDDPVNQSVVKSLVQGTGYEVVSARSGAEALRYVVAAPALPDLVLLDCMMPEMDGYEVLQRLRAMTPHVHLPIIMVSAQTEEDHVVCGLDLGADDYVTKPFKRAELLARIRSQLAYGEWEQDEGVFDTISTMDGGELVNAAAAAAHVAAGRGPAGGPAPPRPAASGAASGGASGGAGGSDDSEAGAVSAALGNLATGPGGVASDGLGGASAAEQRLIVCIDDDDVNQVVLQGMLASQHYRYVRASTGAQGLAFVCGPTNGGIPPDLVLLDCSLPDMTGFDVCRVIRQMYNKQQVPIIMLSARHNESAVVEGLKCGANTYVTKPFRRNELLARIRLHLRSRDGPLQRGASSNDMGQMDEAAAATAAATAAGMVGADGAGSLTLSMLAAPPHRTSLGMGGLGGGSYPQLAAPQAPPPAAAAAQPPLAGAASTATVFPDAAVLVVAVADYAGLCGMLLPGEMAELSGRMLAAFERAVRAAGALPVEAGAGVMSAALLPPPAAAAALDGAGAGLRLAALHRVGRALLDAASTIPVPGTTTCLQLQQALALGTLTVSGAGGAAAGAAPSFFGPVLTELLDLARHAPPMTIVAPDVEAAALRACGATADIRGPLFLEADDASGAGGGAAGPLVSRRLWLVEAHPLAHQYLPPQLLFASGAARGAGFQFAPGAAGGVDAVAQGPHGAGGMVLHHPALAEQQQPGTRSGSAVLLGGPVGGGGGAVVGGMVPISVHHTPGVSGAGTEGAAGSGGAGRALGSSSIASYGAAGGGAGGAGGVGAAASAGLGGPVMGIGLYTHGAGVSRGVSRAFSHTFGLDSDNHGRANSTAAVSVAGGSVAGGGAQTGQTAGTSGNGASLSQATSGLTVGRGGGGNGNGSGGASDVAAAAAMSAVLPSGLDSSSVAGITFSLQAAAAAVAAAATGGGGGGGVAQQQHLTSITGVSGVLLSPAGGASGLHDTAGASGLYFYGSGGAGGRSSLQPMGVLGGGGGGGGGGAGMGYAAPPMQQQLDLASAAAAEPQIRALRNELALMRQQLEALHGAASSSSASNIVAGGGAGYPGGGVGGAQSQQPMPPQQQLSQQQLLHQQLSQQQFSQQLSQQQLQQQQLSQQQQFSQQLSHQQLSQQMSNMGFVDSALAAAAAAVATPQPGGFASASGVAPSTVGSGAAGLPAAASSVGSAAPPAAAESDAGMASNAGSVVPTEKASKKGGKISRLFKMGSSKSSK